jgi:hypothetical protein
MGSQASVALRRSGTFAFFLSFVVISAISAAAQTPTLVWEPSPDPSAVGYMVFWGTSSGSYANSLDIGKALTFVIPVDVGGKYFIAVSAYNADGVAGPRSQEISVTLTAPTAPTAPIPDTSLEDDLPPDVVITMPTTQRQHHTAEAAVVIGGTARDDTGISSVRWQNSRGGEGRATGTDAWIASIPLYSGSNAVSVTAIDTAGNSASTKITIYRRSE